MGRVVTEPELVGLIAEDRRAGRTVAFANGCFDILHVGHVRYLEGARREADRLVVAVNDDGSVRELKGRGRPILAGADRAEMVAALRDVDYVVLFPDRTVERLLRLLRPDVHCKGTDYTEDTVPERHVVREYGGRVAIVGDPKERSSSDVIGRIAGTPNFELQTSNFERTSHSELRTSSGAPQTSDSGQKSETSNLLPLTSNLISKSADLRRLLVVRLGSLGDLVHALPAVSAIGRGYPDLEIDWLVDDVHREFLELVPIVTTIVPLRARTAGAWLEVRRTLRARKYDVAVDFQGLLKSAALARLSGARRVIGFDARAARESAAALFYTEPQAVGEGRHVIEKNLSLAASLGVDTEDLEFPIRAADSAAVSQVQAQGLERFALINAGAAWPNKRWPPDRFGRLAAWLKDRHGLASVVLWGPGEVDLAREVVVASAGAAVVAPETRIADLVALARVARLIVSGDTGPTHIAAAVGTPVVALFGPTNPGRNGPWRGRDMALTRYDSCDCHYERRCRRDAGGWCLGTIGEDEVRRAIDERLGPLSGA